MEGRRKRGVHGLAAALAAVTLLLTTGASSGAAVNSPLETPEEPLLMKRAAELPVLKKTAGGGVVLAAREKATPEGAGEPEELPCPVPETAAVEDTYFDKAVFLGDSRTEGLFLYSGLKTGHFYTAVGATVESVFSKNAWETEEGEKIPLLDAFQDLSCDKVYIMLGVNELGWSKTKTFHDQYAKLIDRVREDHPEAKIALQSLPPVSAKQEAKKSYVNNERIATYNEIIKALAEEKQCYFLDVASCLTGEGGVLPVKQTTDGIHFNVAGCKTWLNYLRYHSLEADAIAAAEKG
ncbi:MAG: hypothetical protein HFG02_09425 [Oscillibacter sp.]|nr:hypothetical protein [Oscillibacter sp.]